MRERYDADSQMGFLAAKVDDLERDALSTSKQLAQHVSECAAIQKKVFGVCCFLSGWTVVHSPESVGLITRVIKAILPAGMP